MRHENEEDGMGFSGLAPTAAEKRDEIKHTQKISDAYEDGLRRGIELAIQIVRYGCGDVAGYGADIAKIVDGALWAAEDRLRQVKDVGDYKKQRAETIASGKDSGAGLAR